MSWNCANGIPYPPHLQSMVLALDRETLEELMLPHMKCYEDMHSAVADGETAIAQRIMAAGFDVYAMESRFTAHAGPTRKNATEFLEWCVDTAEIAGRGELHLYSNIVKFHADFVGKPRRRRCLAHW